ncbi:chitobiase/beta-hexosaminidase C-terminal domain-containing protein [Oceanirhabdus sp. W0125-5]|uniref:chitobiase/beta-hexosaminidase C-terminal domain-containing protein n=1 Tax=Oceanirhabdus sp. W0125-5 TaxID=2999116 RepID=UPI0022F2D860|nr:chitobiase/beta-hexosaminidase C-terminal domain-containing protein [Oceanirhabdus sp. W0125-5]WBW96483.1 FN3 associated domain-containing protein [Oceanirhabdus sp. W0125-5]
MKKFCKKNKKRIISLFISTFMMFSIAFGGYAPVIAKAEENNMFTNGGAEGWTNGKPDGWNGKIENISQSTEQVHGGTYSIKHTSASGTKDFSSVIYDVEPGQEYTISYWYYDNDNMARTRPWMSWKSDTGYLTNDSNVLHPTTYSTDSDGWVQWTATLTAPAEATQFNFEVRAYKDSAGYGGAVYYDDFYFGPSGEVTPSNKVKMVKSTPVAGEVQVGTEVTLTSGTEGAEVYYKIGQEALTTTSGAIKFETPIVINDNTEIHAIAVKEGMENSDEAVFNFTIINDSEFDKIYDIQGEAHTSPKLGQNVKIKGIVTAVSYDMYYPGIFVQEEVGDENNNTSDGIYVSGKITGVKVGDLVTVQGTVSEKEHTAFDARELTVTEITGAQVNVLESGKELPAPIIIGKNGRNLITDIVDNDNMTTFDTTEDAIDLYESLEGMLVKVQNPHIVGVQEKYGTFDVLADNGEASLDKLSIKGGIIPTKSNVNPEILHIDDVVIPLSPNKIFTDSRFNNAKVGDKFSQDIVGVMDYNFGFYKIYNVNELPDLNPGANERETTTIQFNEDKLTIAVYNIENFSADPSHTPDKKVAKIADSIINDLGAPDIVTLVEVQDNNGPNSGGTEANESYMRLINKIVADGGPEYNFTDVAPVDGQDGGEPGGNIRVGYIYRKDRVGFDENRGGATEAATMDGKHLAKNPSRIDPTNSYFDSSRKPLVGEFKFKGESVFLIANHLGSKRGDESDFGEIQPPPKGSEPKRHGQAEVINSFVKEILAADPNANIVVLGDMNDYEYSETLRILKGDELINMVEKLPKNERYTYVYNGNSQVLDSTLVSKNIEARTIGDIVHLNAEFTEHSGRASDHDPVMVQISGLGNVEYVEPVKFNILDEEVKVGTEVVLSTDTEGATIYYTIDDSTYNLYESDPITDGIEYTGPFALTETGIIKVQAVAKKGEKYSIVTSSKNIVDYARINPSHGSGEINKGEVVTIIADENNVEIFYSVGEDSNPSDGQLFPVEGLEINENSYFRIVLKKDGVFSNVVREFEYTVLAQDEIISIEEAKIKTGESVKIKGIITGMIGNNAFIQDDTAGIYLYVGANAQTEFVVGNELILSGRVVEYNKLCELKEIDDIEIVSTGNNLPAPKVVTIGEIDETLEGQLVTITNLEISEVPSGEENNYSMKVTDGISIIELRVDKYLNPGINSDDYSVGMKMNVTAPVGQFYDKYQLMLRSSDDITKEISIAEAREKAIGEEVMVKGIITGMIGNNAFIQDDTAGIYLYAGSKGKEEFVLGNELQLIGVTSEYKGLKQLKYFESINVVSTGNNLPEPKVVTIGEIDETLEGQLVTLNDVEIIQVPSEPISNNFSMKVSDGTNIIELRVDKYLNPSIYSGDYEAVMKVNVTAPVGQYNDNYQLMVRSSADIDEILEDISLVEASVEGGKVLLDTEVELSTKTEGAEIYYTTDGSNPVENGTLYTEAITLNTVGKITIKAVAKKRSSFSEVTEFKYIIVGEKKFTINSIQTTDMMNNPKNEFRMKSAIMINVDITANIDTEAVVIMKIVGKHNNVYFFNFFNNAELEDGITKSFSSGVTLFNAPIGNYKAEILVCDNLIEMNPLSQVGEYYFTINNRGKGQDDKDKNKDDDEDEEEYDEDENENNDSNGNGNAYGKNKKDKEKDENNKGQDKKNRGKGKKN